VRYRINFRPDETPLEDYMSRQKRYASVMGDVSHLKAMIDEQWRFLNGMAKAFPAHEGD
jgi:hypothetical protein